MDTQSRRALTALSKSAKLLVSGKRSKIATKAKVGPRSKRKFAALDGYLIADEKKLGKYLDLMPEAYEELRRFLPCAIERLGERRIALIPFVNAVGMKIVLVAIEFKANNIAVGNAVAEVIRECGPRAGDGSVDLLLEVLPSSNVLEDMRRAANDV